MYLSRVARHVHTLVRGDNLSDTMSSYLLQRLEAQPNIEIHFGSITGPGPTSSHAVPINQRQ